MEPREMSPEDVQSPTPRRATNLSASSTIVDPDSSPHTPHISDANSNEHHETTGPAPSNINGNSASANQLPKDPIQGWPQVALLMAKNPDFAAFSRFKELNIKSLLYYQAQLALLKERLHELEYKDATREENWPMFADSLVRSDSEQFETVKKMRVVLKEYSEFDFSSIPPISRGPN